MTFSRHRLVLSAAFLAVIGTGGTLFWLTAREQADVLPNNIPLGANASSDSPKLHSPAATPSRKNTATLLLANPVVSMNAEKGLLEATLTVTVTRPDGYPVAGAISVTGIPKLEASSKRFYLRDPVITTMQLPELGEQDRAALTTAIRTFFLSRPVFAPFEPGGLHIQPMEAPLAASGS